MPGVDMDLDLELRGLAGCVVADVRVVLFCAAAVIQRFSFDASIVHDS